MKGAYCPDCRELGPDLVLKAPEGAPPLAGRIQFTCSRCKAVWTWEVDSTGAGLVYRNPRRRVLN